MLLATIENTSTTDTIGPGRGLTLPAPFDWVELAPSASRILPVTAEELTERNENTGFTPGTLLQMLVQEGSLLISFIVDVNVNPIGDAAIAAYGSGLPPFTGDQFAALIENPGSTPVFQRLTEDMILPAWALTAGISVSQVEIGDTVINALLTFTYSRPPDSATINDGSGPIALVSPFLSYLAPGPYLETAINATQLFTLTANELGFTPKITTTTISWRPLVFYGVSTVPGGGYTEAFIEGLATSALAANRNRTIAYSAAAGEKLYYAYPATYGAATFVDSATSFSAGFTNVATTNVTNGFGITNSYDVYESDQSGLGAVDIEVL